VDIDGFLWNGIADRRDGADRSVPYRGSGTVRSRIPLSPIRNMLVRCKRDERSTQVASVTAAVLKGLEYLHSQSIIHR
jgi:serine/threonine protein kinase